MLEANKDRNKTRGRPKAERQEALIRCQVTFPEALLNQVKAFGEGEHITLIEAIRRLLKYGLLMVTLAKDKNVKLFVREGDNEREIVLV